ncbi:hypothetical protein SH668x_003292 [Planctomicrobium sp. SH668]|uniref:hypothetical protein n=1 Tax=Planctomicrobium sp. SH668 TaxID=3448126 RepID=UPI003F5B1EEF
MMRFSPVMLSFAALLISIAFPLNSTPANAEERVAKVSDAFAEDLYEVRNVEGWTLRIHRRLNEIDEEKVLRAIVLLKIQLEEVVRLLPEETVAKLREVPLWFSPEYEGKGPSAEYHPSQRWLEENGRNPAMARSVEFTNVRIFDAEVRRMPNFALHELAHAYQDRFLTEEQDRMISAAFKEAVKSGKYQDVEIQDSEGQRHKGRAYALTNYNEYFAECTESYFVRNDIYPFNREEILVADPDFAKILPGLWGVPEEQ